MLMEYGRTEITSRGEQGRALIHCVSTALC
jgi:hypothetical protein